MSRNFIVLALCISVIVMFCSCDKSTEVIVEPPLVVDINTVINMTTFEKIESGMKTLEFRCLTQDDFPCANYVIDFNLAVTTDTIDLNFTEITRPQICLTTVGKAFGIVNLGTLANNTYEFPIRVNSDTVMADITVTDSTIEITGANGTWTNLLRPNLRRIPDNIIWGQVGYHNAADLGIANTYFDSLTNRGATVAVLTTGSYGYFYIDNSSQADSIVELGATIGTAFRIPYVYQYGGDTASLHTLIQNFANQGNTVEVNVITDDGYEFRSW